MRAGGEGQAHKKRRWCQALASRCLKQFSLFCLFGHLTSLYCHLLIWLFNPRGPFLSRAFLGTLEQPSVDLLFLRLFKRFFKLGLGVGLGLGLGLGIVLGLRLGTRLALGLRVGWVLCVTTRSYSN